MGDLIKDHMIWIIGVALATWQLVEEARKKKRKWLIFLLFVGIGTLAYLGIDQNNRNNTEKSALKNDIKVLSNDMAVIKTDNSGLRSQIAKGNEKFQELKSSLLKINIGIDSITNRPFKIEYKTTINKADKVIFDQK